MVWAGFSAFHGHLAFGFGFYISHLAFWHSGVLHVGGLVLSIEYVA